jgi:uncharacterized delta-60 repeat protein
MKLADKAASNRPKNKEGLIMKYRLFISSLTVTMVIFISYPAFCATVARYNSLPHGNDRATAIATDSSGNVYVTGSSDGGNGNSAYATVAYDASGKRLWVRRYNGPANKVNEARAIATDASGNIYVTGVSYGGSKTNNDYATVAYDGGGNELWVKRYNGPANKDDEARAITTDSSGNVYVTGISNGGSKTNYDYATVAYDASGNELWVKRYNGPANDWDNAAAIATDASGNIYVTGSILGSGGYEYATVAYDASGNVLWVRRYMDIEAAYHDPSAIATDASGNIYVTGSVGRDFTSHYVTVAYDASGNVLWATRWDGPVEDRDDPSAIAIDASGNIYVTGSSMNEDGYIADYVTVAYDASGNELWVRWYDGPGSANDLAEAIAIDPSGNIHVTGRSTSGYDFDNDNDDDTAYATVAYDGSGNELWVRRYNGPAKDNVGTAIATDSSGHVYVTGSSAGIGTGDDYATIAYDSRGTRLWLQRYNNPEGPDDDAAKAIATDSSGNVYVTGDNGTIAYDSNLNRLWVRSDDGGKGRTIVTDSSSNVYVTGCDREFSGDGCATAAYNSRGVRLWVRTNALEGENDAYIATAIATDGSGNVYVTGYSTSDNGSDDYITEAYNSSGDWLWQREYNGPGDSHDRAAAIATDASGNVYVTGVSYGGSKTNYDYATVAYDSSGNQLWVRRYNGPGDFYDRATAIATDASGNVYVTGRSIGVNEDYATVVYNSRGTQLWVRRYNGPGNGIDGANAIATDSAGRLYVTGYSYGGGSKGYDFATVAYNTRGKQLWVRRYNGPRNLYDEAHAIAVDSAGRVYVSGQSIGNGTGADYATIAYNLNGTPLWAKRYNGPGNAVDIAQAMAIGSSGQVYVTGKSQGKGTGYDYATVKY